MDWPFKDHHAAPGLNCLTCCIECCCPGQLRSYHYLAGCSAATAQCWFCRRIVTQRGWWWSFWDQATPLQFRCLAGIEGKTLGVETRSRIHGPVHYYIFAFIVIYIQPRYYFEVSNDQEGTTATELKAVMGFRMTGGTMPFDAVNTYGSQGLQNCKGLCVPAVSICTCGTIFLWKDMENHLCLYPSNVRQCHLLS